MAAALTACVSDNDLNPVERHGYINLNLSNQPSMVATRGDAVTEEVEEQDNMTVNQSDYKNWNLKIFSVTTENGEKKETECTEQLNTAYQYVVPAGTYKIYASKPANIDAATLPTVTTGWGEPYYANNSGEVTVATAKTETATIKCGKAKNTRVGVSFNFGGLSVNNAKLGITKIHRATTEGQDWTEKALQNVVFTAETKEEYAYFKVGDKIEYEFTYDYGSNTGKKITGEITLDKVASTHMISVTTNTSGTINITVTYNDKFETIIKDEITIDAVTGEPSGKSTPEEGTEE